MILKIKPLDTFFFKDGKPFTLGDETWADSVFPPSPSIIYGALRTLYFSSHPDEFEKAILLEKPTLRDPTDDLKVTGIFLEIDEDVCLPVPADFVVHKERSEDKSLLKVVERDNQCFSNHKIKYVAIADDMVEKTENNPLFLKIHYQQYLNGKNIKGLNCITAKEYLQSEPKVGIGRGDATRTAEEGKLYRVDMQRFKDVDVQPFKKKEISLLIVVDGLKLPERGFMKLGGEGKVAHYEAITDEGKTKITQVDTFNEYFKLCLSTPAIFTQGWLPSWIDEQTLKGKYKGLQLRLLTAIVGKYVSIGGFDMKKGKPKPMYKAVPTGSVYYFQLLGGTAENVIKVFHQQAISDLKANEGFGITYVGKTPAPLKN